LLDLFGDAFLVLLVDNRLLIKVQLKFALHFPLKFFDVKVRIFIRKTRDLLKGILDVLIDAQELRD
jgi:hypothetical protein